MLQSNTEFPQPGSEATLLDGGKRCRILQTCANGELLITIGPAGTKRVQPGELVPAIATRGPDFIGKGHA